MGYLEECYVCKRESDNSHPFYSELCPTCGIFNLKKRESSADLAGYTALVTGGRLKVGFETALKLLRCGARVVVTTRFFEDAQTRFAQQADYDSWRNRLQVYAADFREATSVEELVQWINDEFSQLDILINNAAQTLRRPPAFYRHLIAKQSDARLIPMPGEEGLLQVSTHKVGLAGMEAEQRLGVGYSRRDPGFVALLSQIPLLPGDGIYESDLFPEGQFDQDGQQSDRRDTNSWMMKLEDVSLIEFLEVMYTNVVAPFLLCSRLKKRMMKKQDEQPSFVINVSAMEGNFHDPDKNWRHPHTNMAKAALNMMTRTSASEFLADGIYMNSVDPGWITNERPFPLDASESNRKTKMAIDEIDGAARVLDPIFRAIKEGEYFSGVLLKNYMVYPW